MTSEPPPNDSGPPTTPGPPQVVVVGAASRDLAPDDPRGWRLGGGVSYSALAVARLGLRVGAVIGADQPAATADELAALRSAGVAVVIAPLERGPVFDNVETPAGRRQVALVGSDSLPVDAVPAGWAGAAGWILAPVAGELGEEWAEVPPEAALVALGWQGLLREVRDGAPVRRAPPVPSGLLRRADLVGVSRDDLDPGTDLQALTGLLRVGATLLVTAGGGGGVAAEVPPPSSAPTLHRWPAIPSDRVVDPTGAGDVFLAAVLAARADPRLVGGRIAQRYDLLLGAAVASLVVEAPGLAGVPDRAAIQRRMTEARTRSSNRGP